MSSRKEEFLGLECDGGRVRLGRNNEANLLPRTHTEKKKRKNYKNQNNQAEFGRKGGNSSEKALKIRGTKLEK